MPQPEYSKKLYNFFSFRGLSMQQRLPLFICLLLFCIIAAFTIISYIGVRKAAMNSGTERLTTLTDQLSTMFGQSAPNLLAATHSAAGQTPVVSFMRSGKVQADSAVTTLLQKLRPDSSWVLAELVNSSNEVVFQSCLPGVTINLDRDSVISYLSPGPDSSKIGKLYGLHDSVYYPIIASITDNKRVIGYLIRWRLQRATPKAISQFSQLIGSDAKLIIGNIDGSLWTDLTRPVPAPPVNSHELKNISEYSRAGQDRMIASLRPVPKTPWLVLVEFPRKIVVQSAHSFLKWIIIVGVSLILIGFFSAWLLSRKITQPIKNLTVAASAIASGDFSQKVEINRTDEIGKLGRAFNTMMIQIGNAQNILEKKVQQRTAQLEESNKELEAFSYSVSHDLRAPLRIINGYSEIISTDYSDRLDCEGKRMLGIITENAKKMGNLIDDLLNLSRLGRKEMLYHRVDMNNLVASAIEQQALFKPHVPAINVGILESAYCDSTLIRQVWINLISNAVKYSANRDKPLIEINSFRKENEIIYRIKDNGVGFSMEYADKLFGVFQRLHNMSEFEGTGVGLALVHRIITKHDGRVWAEAEENKGAVFYFSLPDKKEHYIKTSKDQKQ